MKRDTARDIMIYYSNIPEMLKSEQEIKDYIEAKYYDGGKALNMDGMPHGTSIGSPTEKMGIKAAQENARGRLERVQIMEDVLTGDRDRIENCIEAMNGKYKNLLMSRYIQGYSWGKISVQMKRPEGTIRRWHDKALDRLGEIIEEDVPMPEELAFRAYRAR